MMYHSRSTMLFHMIKRLKVKLHERKFNAETTNGRICTELINSTLLIELDRSNKRNAITQDMSLTLKKALIDFENNEKAQVAIIHGVGGNFCAGYDLNEIATVGCDYHTMDLDMKRSKPLIAAMEGYAVGSGLELALFCDIRIASDNASLGFLNRRYGLPLVDGGTVRLPQLIGLSRAMDLILTGRCLDAKAALEWGLVHKVVTVGAVLGQAFSLAGTLCNFPNDAIGADLESVIYACSENVSQDDALNHEKQNSRKAFPQGFKGAKRFVEEGLGKHGSFKRVNNLS